jgi:hypothetical protein
MAKDAMVGGPDGEGTPSAPRRKSSSHAGLMAPLKLSRNQVQASSLTSSH